MTTLAENLGKMKKLGTSANKAQVKTKATKPRRTSKTHKAQN